MSEELACFRSGLLRLGLRHPMLISLISGSATLALAISRWTNSWSRCGGIDMSAVSLDRGDRQDL